MFSRFLAVFAAAVFWFGSSAASFGQQIRTDRILVKFKPGEAPLGDERPLGKVVRRFPALGIEVIQLTTGGTVEQALAAYKADARVVYAQPDNIRGKQAVPNDPGTSEGDAWHLENDGRELGKLHADIAARAAWEIRHDAPEVVVAVLDTGIRYTHEDLAANMWTNEAEANGQPGVDDDGDGIVDDVFGANLITNTGVPMDDEGHGTFVAGLIGAVGNNGKGVTGICWKVKLMAVKVLDGSGRGADSDIIAGMEYARQHGAKIINASLGRTNNLTPAVNDAVAALAADGVILVAAAGNNSANNDFDLDVSNYPSSAPQWNVVSVAATTRNDLLAIFSNFGWRSVDLGAPGVQVPSTSSKSDTSYEVESGTSMSAPIVAGALALLTAHTPGLTPVQRIERMLKAVDPVPSLAGRCLSGGRLNLERTLLGGSVAPTNDAFSRSLPIGSDIRFTGSGVTTAASTEAGEPGSATAGFTKRTLWFNWTAPYTGKVKIATSVAGTPGADLPPALAVYQGRASLSSLQMVGTNLSGNQVGSQFVTFDAVYEKEYSICLQNGADAGTASSFYGIYDVAQDGFGDYTILSVDLYGPGSVTPAKLLGETIQKRGKKITLKATPAPGYILYGWVDPTVDNPEDGILSRQPVYTFALENKGFSAVQALFIQNPFRDLKGHYNGLATLESGANAGFLTLDLAETGSFTASIRIGPKTYRFKGVLRSDRKFDVTIKRPNDTPLVVHLELNRERRITGTIGSGEGEYSLLAEAGNFSFQTNPALSAGNYTIKLPAVNPSAVVPGGTGYGLLTVSQSGNVRLNGVLGDGQKLSLGSTLYRTGYWAVYASPYARGGFISGLATYDESQPTTDWTGDLTWTKIATFRDGTYPNGFIDAKVQLSGSRYTVPPSTGTAIAVATVPTSSNNIRITLEGASLPPTEFLANLQPGNFIQPSSILNMSVFGSTGEFAANFIAEGQIRTFHGMFFQKEGIGEGYFIRGQQTGKVLVTPLQ